MSSFVAILLMCVHWITTTDSQCQYVTYNWDSVTDSNKAGAIRKYEDAMGGSAYLPPFPKLFAGVDNETFATIPYPTDVCLQTDNEDTNVLSFKFKCSNGQLSIQIWRKDTNCTGDADDGFTQSKDNNDLFDGNLLHYECDNSLEPCEYIYIMEAYYSYNDSLDTTHAHSIHDTCHEDDKLDRSYYGAYAVDVCIQNNIGSFQYSCDSRTATYTLTQYSDTQCTSISESMQMGDAHGHNHNQGTECTTDFILDIVNLGSNLTADYDDTRDTIEAAQSTFIKCTSADAFELAFKDYCVASQVTLIDDDHNNDKTVMARFGPFGVRSVSERKLSRIIECDPCDIIEGCMQEWSEWDQTILLIDAMHTQNITAQCTGGAKQFVMDIQSMNVTIHGIIFASNHNISHLIEDANDISIPIRVMSTGRFAFRYFDSDPFFNGSASVSTKVSSLSCNYRDGYPAEICVTTSCEEANATQTCSHIKFAGTYFIQNMSDVRHKYNSNPIWIKESYGGLPTQYIWLDAVIMDDSYVELRWVVSSHIGNVTAGLYCTIVDLNQANVAIDGESVSNFDVSSCQWQTISTENDTMRNVDSAPYQCFNNLFNVPIALVCVSTYQNNASEIVQYAGTYYELASDSAIYMQNKSEEDVAPSVVGAVKLGYKYECEFETESQEEEVVYGGYYAFYGESMVPQECKRAYSNLNWILYDSHDNKIKAYCDSMELALQPGLSVKACNGWLVWNADADAYRLDNSFDVDIDQCLHEEHGEEDEIDLPSLNEYSDALCFELNLNHSEGQFMYSPVQYLWGQYTKLSSQYTFDHRPIYQNNRLNNTPFDTYLLWYDPKDAWVFLTKSDLLSQNLETPRFIFDSFDGIINSLHSAIVAYCDNNNDDEALFPEECEFGWTVHNERFYLTNLSLTRCVADVEAVVDTVSFTKNAEIKDLCVAFYEREDECILPNEDDNALNKKPACDTPSYFETVDWCNTTTEGDCRALDGNGIYTQFGDQDIGLRRSYWIHEDGDDDDKVFYYVYYHQQLRLWVWTTDNGDYGDKADHVSVLNELGISAYCLKWDLDAPDECSEFFYEEMDSKKNTSSVVEDCTIYRDGSKDLVGEISAWVILSCFVCGLCVFCIGFYKEYMQKRHNKNKSARISILGDAAQLDMVTHLQENQPDTIEEDEEKAPEEVAMDHVIVEEDLALDNLGQDRSILL